MVEFREKFQEDDITLKEILEIFSGEHSEELSERQFSGENLVRIPKGISSGIY